MACNMQHNYEQEDEPIEPKLVVELGTDVDATTTKVVEAAMAEGTEAAGEGDQSVEAPQEAAVEAPTTPPVEAEPVQEVPVAEAPVAETPPAKVAEAAAVQFVDVPVAAAVEDGPTKEAPAAAAPAAPSAPAMTDVVMSTQGADAAADMHASNVLAAAVTAAALSHAVDMVADELDAEAAQEIKDAPVAVALAERPAWGFVSHAEWATATVFVSHPAPSGGVAIVCDAEQRAVEALMAQAAEAAKPSAPSAVPPPTPATLDDGMRTQEADGSKEALATAPTAAEDVDADAVHALAAAVTTAALSQAVETAEGAADTEAAQSVVAAALAEALAIACTREPQAALPVEQADETAMAAEATDTADEATVVHEVAPPAAVGVAAASMADADEVRYLADSTAAAIIAQAIETACAAEATSAATVNSPKPWVKEPLFVSPFLEKTVLVAPAEADEIAVTAPTCGENDGEDVYTI